MTGVRIEKTLEGLLQVENYMRKRLRDFESEEVSEEVEKREQVLSCDEVIQEVV